MYKIIFTLILSFNTIFAMDLEMTDLEVDLNMQPMQYTEFPDINFIESIQPETLNGPNGNILNDEKKIDCSFDAQSIEEFWQSNQDGEKNFEVYDPTDIKQEIYKCNWPNCDFEGNCQLLKFHESLHAFLSCAK